jgi:hypothetical protein
MLTAYLDECGHQGKDLVILAGFLGNKDQWEKCEVAWREGLGRRKNLHMNKLRWSRPDRVRKLLGTLGPIPHNAGLRALFCCVKVADYEDMVSGRLVEKLVKGYYIALIGMLDAIRKNVPADETVKISLEIQTEYEVRASLIFDSYKVYKTPDGRPKLTSIEFIPKGTSQLTQPADYLAYALWQLYKDRQSDRSELCSSILQNTQSAIGMNLMRDIPKLRTFLANTIKKHPNLMKKWEEYD